MHELESFILAGLPSATSAATAGRRRTASAAGTWRTASRITSTAWARWTAASRIITSGRRRGRATRIITSSAFARRIWTWFWWTTPAVSWVTSAIRRITSLRTSGAYRRTTWTGGVSAIWSHTLVRDTASGAAGTRIGCAAWWRSIRAATYVRSFANHSGTNFSGTHYPSRWVARLIGTGPATRWLSVGYIRRSSG